MEDKYPTEWQGVCKKHNEQQPCWDCCDDYMQEYKDEGCE